MTSAIETFLAPLLPVDGRHYQLAASLDEHEGPINTLAFNTGSTLLASGGLYILVSLYSSLKRLNDIRR